MPRVARQKTNCSIYHVMSKSISEVDLFRCNDDKLKYIHFIKKYQEIHKFEIYSYCFMTNHLHMIMDTKGADISQIMQCINFCYATYFNGKYKRCGHLFHDRFKSKIIDTDRYLIAATAYIHNNPTDIPEYKKAPEKFEFSSLGVYLGLGVDPHNLVKTNFVMQFFSSDSFVLRKKYYELVLKSNEEMKDEFEFENQGTKYKSNKTNINRNIEPEKVIDYIAQLTKVEKSLLNVKGNHAVVRAKALTVLMLKSLCNFNGPEICRMLGNITQSNVSRLTKIGLNIVRHDEKFSSVFKEILHF